MKKTDRNTETWDNLIARYFDAETTAEEERRLRRFLTSPESSGAQYDEVRAVMGFLITGKELHNKPVSTGRKHRHDLIVRFSAAAAIFVVVGCSLLLLWQKQPGTPVLADAHSNEDVCIAYINGEEITDPHIVMAQMHADIARTSRPDNATSVEKQLTDIFDGL